jgi:prepilin-type N-terminal cleavage/methylation domain-containing protein
MLRLKQRKGFTLIELLIVIVIIGILAAVAIPKFGKTREKAFLKAMQSDLRNLMSQQELYFSIPANNYTYAPSLANLPDAITSQGVTAAITAAGNTGWAATAAHQGLTAGQLCAVWFGTSVTVPAPANAATPGVVFCSE